MCKKRVQNFKKGLKRQKYLLKLEIIKSECHSDTAMSSFILSRYSLKFWREKDILRILNYVNAWRQRKKNSFQCYLAARYHYA